MNSEMKKALGAGVTCLGCLLFLILFPLGWSVLEPTEYGIEINTISKSINEDRIYGPGRYFLGVGNEFLKFPSNLQVIDFSPDSDAGGPPLNAGTRDGQTVIIEVSIYFRVQRDSLLSLYRFASVDYQPQLISRAQAALKDTAIEFSTLEYFTAREDIADRMLTNVAKSLSEVFVTVELLQLRNIGLPSSLEEALIRKVVAQQQKNTAEASKTVDLVRAKTDLIVSEADANITKITGQASAEARLELELARAKGTQVVTQVQSSALGLLREELNFTNAQLFKYLWYTRKLRTVSESDTLVVGLDNGVLQLQS